MTGTASSPYATHLDVKLGPLEWRSWMCPRSSQPARDRWYNQTLCRVNDSVVRLGVIQGEYHWHKHDDDDEFFYVVEGRFLIDLEGGTPRGRTVELGPHQGFVVPKGVVHRTRAPERTVILHGRRGRHRADGGSVGQATIVGIRSNSHIAWRGSRRPRLRPEAGGSSSILRGRSAVSAALQLTPR